MATNHEILILGAGGGLGTALASGFADLDAVGTTRSGIGATIAVDVGDEAALRGVIETVAPHYILYAAGIADPDACERDPDLSKRVNLDGLGHVLRHARAQGSRVLYYSTDYVFGSAGEYDEHARTSPLQTYGRHKRQAEQLLLGFDAAHLVLRLPLLFGATVPGRDFVTSTAQALREGRPLRRDERRRYPVSVDHVVAVTRRLIADSELEPGGVFHVEGSDGTSKSEWACYIAGLLGIEPRFDSTPAPAPLAPRPDGARLRSLHPELCASTPGELWRRTREIVAAL